MLRKTIVFFCVVAAMMLASCIEDGVSTNPSEQPTFSVDTLKMGDIFTAESTPTSRFIVYNRYDKIMSIETITLRESDKGIFRLNVDGISAKSFSNVEIRPNDSIFVFVEALVPENGKVEPVTVDGHLDFKTHGNVKTVVIRAESQDVTRLRASKIEKNTHFTAGKPYQIFDSLVVAEGVTLTIDAGARILFHDAAYMKVYGTLQSKGTAENPVNFTGDRTGFVASDIPYEIMSGQWDGIFFAPTSKSNRFEYTSVRNMETGIVLDNVEASPAVVFVASQVHNSAGVTLVSLHSDVEAYATEFSDAALGVMCLYGGKHVLNHCTFANYYLFSAISGAALQFTHLNADSDDESGKPYLSADISNCIIYGYGSELSHGDLTGTGVTIRNTLFKTKGVDDDNFINCLWDADPLYYTVRDDYYFDYRLQPESPAIGAADASLTKELSKKDRYGKTQPGQPDLGAYVFVAPEE